MIGYKGRKQFSWNSLRAGTVLGHGYLAENLKLTILVELTVTWEIPPQKSTENKQAIRV